MRQKVRFSTLKVGDTFNVDGNTWIKKSSRTAEIVDCKRFYHPVEYFNQSEMVTIEKGEIK